MLANCTNKLTSVDEKNKYYTLNQYLYRWPLDGTSADEDIDIWFIEDDDKSCTWKSDDDKIQEVSLFDPFDVYKNATIGDIRTLDMLTK